MSVVFVVSIEKKDELQEINPQFFGAWAQRLGYKQASIATPKLFQVEVIKTPGIDVVYVPDDASLKGRLIPRRVLVLESGTPQEIAEQKQKREQKALLEQKAVLQREATAFKKNVLDSLEHVDLHVGSPLYFPGRTKEQNYVSNLQRYSPEPYMVSDEGEETGAWLSYTRDGLPVHKRLLWYMDGVGIEGSPAFPDMLGLWEYIKSKGI